MKLSAANALSLSRIPTGAALAWIAGLDASERTTARRLLGLYLAGVLTDEFDGMLARRSGVITPKIDSLCDMSLLVGLLTGSTRLRGSRRRAAVALALPPGYALVRLVKPHASPSAVRHMNQLFFVGSIAIIAAQLAELARIAGLSRGQVAGALAAGLATLAATNRQRVTRALDGRP
ncbi:MAG: CDP-alcohol phosphatidyltransferase [Candidatus Saccharibacteria bacterium]|jgi:phosphatidylglycerophosphate synthase|nr:CDP-alcohol phosphatidyltransferase [Candidatus Saccharibacteria bacterium]